MFLTKEALTLFIFKEVEGSKGVEFNGNLQRFYVVSYKNFLVENNYEVATINKKINSIHALNRYLVVTGAMKEIVVENYKDSLWFRETNRSLFTKSGSLYR